MEIKKNTYDLGKITKKTKETPKQMSGGRGEKQKTVELGSSRSSLKKEPFTP